ncbi:srs domain-containing protein [Neospora caninum Liverpool]|uniref:Srs domain-containing protein n=1 Tax=Neospora caninum (strain Liverpool) TaxID=572307 RepID=F0V810_NEOCL|nr:srs domain-containing protein [Neospora caninum Liverpool]CBZ49851.1 srs domain-containing protein [Neospora caninum Liverpool]CEL64440.1 TPA: SRS domain-containing protein [Neospora caninum Liverpool]|eukprot:XP_003879886.1 srs domain-containing protein [Neospora caninum Liverpool]
MKTAVLTFAAILGVASLAPQLIHCSASSNTTTEVQQCSGEKLELTGGAKVSLKFQCATGQTLKPTDDKVYEYTDTCNTNKTHKLADLVPGSQLASSQATAQAMRKGRASGDDQQVYTLTLGDAPQEKQVFCYRCEANGDGGRQTGKTPCSVVVTVPQSGSSGAAEIGVTTAVLTGAVVLGTFAMH